MISRKQWRRFIDHPYVEWTIFAGGMLLLLLSPVVGVLPGPGGIIVAGVAMIVSAKPVPAAKPSRALAAVRAR